MDAARTATRRARLLGAAVCLSAVLAVLIGGVVRADVAAHHRTPAAAISAVVGDAGGSGARADHPLVLTAAGALLLAVLVLRRTANPSASVQVLTADSRSARGPPRHRS